MPKPKEMPVGAGVPEHLRAKGFAVRVIIPDFILDVTPMEPGRILRAIAEVDDAPWFISKPGGWRHA